MGARPMLELMRSGSVAAAAVSGPAEQAQRVRRRLAVRVNAGAAVRLLTLLGALNDDLGILVFHLLRSSLGCSSSHSNQAASTRSETWPPLCLRTTSPKTRFKSSGVSGKRDSASSTESLDASRNLRLMNSGRYFSKYSTSQSTPSIRPAFIHSAATQPPLQSGRCAQVPHARCGL